MIDHKDESLLDLETNHDDQGSPLFDRDQMKFMKKAGLAVVGCLIVYGLGHSNGYESGFVDGKKAEVKSRALISAAQLDKKYVDGATAYFHETDPVFQIKGLQDIVEAASEGHKQAQKVLPGIAMSDCGIDPMMVGTKYTVVLGENTLASCAKKKGVSIDPN